MWKMTEAGVQFVEGKLQLQKYRLFYNKQSFDYEGDDQKKVWIWDTFKDPFDYEELMRGGSDAASE